MLKNLLTMVALCLSVTGYSQTFVVDHITYSITSTSPNKVEITDYNTSGGTDVTIPDTVVDPSTSQSYDVTSIGQSVFFNKGLTSVEIGSNVTTIKDQAFYQNSLTSLTLPNSVTSIGFGAFWSNQLTELTLPNNILSIREQAFIYNQLTSVTIPNSVSSIGDRAFARNQLSSVTLGENVSSIGAYAFGNNLLTSITLPSNVSNIKAVAFRDNPLTSIISKNPNPPNITTGGSNDSFNANRSGIDLTIPTGKTGPYVNDAGAKWTGFKSVSEIFVVGSCFSVDHITYQVSSMTNNNNNNNNTAMVVDYNIAGGSDVNIPATVDMNAMTFQVISIGKQAFLDKQLTSVNIPSSITDIDQSAFENNQLTSVVIPDGLISIKYATFRNNKLSSVDIPASVTILGSFAFAENQLTSLSIPSGIVEIERNTFQDNLLTSLEIPNGVTYIDQHAFSNNKLASVSLGSGMTYISESTFENNLLTSITLPENITDLDRRAFGRNPLNAVIALATTPPTINTTGDTLDTFGEGRSDIDLTIPAGTMGPYVTDAGALWTGFKSVTEGGTVRTFNLELANQVTLLNAYNLITVQTSDDLPLQYYHLYSLSGALIRSGSNNEIPIQGLSQGMYVLQLGFEEGEVVKKVIKGN